MAKPPRPSSSKAPPAATHRIGARTRIRNYFLTGIIVAGPVAITVYIALWFIQLVDSWVKPLVPPRYLPETYLPFTIPGFGLLVAFLALTLLGFLTANLVGRSLLESRRGRPRPHAVSCAASTRA